MKAFIHRLKWPLLLLSISLLRMLSVGAQPDTTKVEVVKDPRIDLLVKKQALINKIAVFKNSRGEYKGYRIMVLNTNNRDLAYKTRADILRYYPDYNVYMAYQSPYYKLKVGDFVKRPEADSFKKELSSMFPQGMFVIQDIIHLSPEDEARLLKEEEEE